MNEHENTMHEQSGRDTLTAAPGTVSPEREGEVAPAAADLTREGTPATPGTAPDNSPVSDSEPDNSPVPDSESDNSPVPDSESDNSPVPDSESDNSPVSDSESDDSPVSDSASDTPVTDGASAAASAQTAETDGTPETVPCGTQTEQQATYDLQVGALLAAYPNADPEREMQDPAVLALVTGTVRPTLRQAYELCHREELTAQAVQRAVSAAVREAEERLLTNIRVRGLRPTENGTDAAGAVQTHAAVDRLTRAERADLARRAEQGDHVRL